MAVLDLQASQMALMVKNLPATAGDVRNTGSIPGSGRSLREGKGNILQYSRLENPMDRGAWQATDHGTARVGHDLVTKPPPRINQKSLGGEWETY